MEPRIQLPPGYAREPSESIASRRMGMFNFSSLARLDIWPEFQQCTVWCKVVRGCAQDKSDPFGQKKAVAAEKCHATCQQIRCRVCLANASRHFLLEHFVRSEVAQPVA